MQEALYPKISVTFVVPIVGYPFQEALEESVAEALVEILQVLCQDEVAHPGFLESHEELLNG